MKHGNSLLFCKTTPQYVWCLCYFISSKQALLPCNYSYPGHQWALCSFSIYTSVHILSELLAIFIWLITFSFLTDIFYLASRLMLVCFFLFFFELLWPFLLSPVSWFLLITLTYSCNSDLWINAETFILLY